MKRWVIRVGIVLVLIGLGVLFKFYVLTPDPIPVSVVPVERGRVEETVTNSRAGTVKARQRAKLSPEIGGRVAEIPHRFIGEVYHRKKARFVDLPENFQSNRRRPEARERIFTQ